MKLEMPVKIYVGFVITIGSALIALCVFRSGIHLRDATLVGAIYFLALGFIAESYPIRIKKDSLIAISSAVSIASILLFDVYVAAIVRFLAAMLAMQKVKGGYAHLLNRPLYKSLFNGSARGLEVFCAGLAYHYLSLAAPRIAFLNFNLLGLMALVGVYFVVDTTVYAILFSLLAKTRLRDEIADQFKTANHFILLIPFGVLLAGLYAWQGIIPIVLFFGPFLFARHVLEQSINARQTFEEVTTLYQALSKITGTPENVKALSHQIAEIIVHDFRAYECGVWLLSDDKGRLDRGAYCGPEIITEDDFIPMDTGGFVTTVANTGEIIYAADVRKDARYRETDSQTCSEFAVPLKVHGAVLGVINMESPQMDDFPEHTRRLVTTFAEHAALAIQNAGLLSSLEKNLAELKESQERINFFLEHTSEGVYRLDYTPPIPTTLSFEEQFRLSVERGKIAECNDAFARMYGYSGRANMLGKPYIDFYGEEGYEVNLEGNLQFYRDGYRSDEMETQEFNAAGEKIFFSNNVIGIIKNGYFVSTWGTQRDITPLKKALADLEKLNSELEHKLAELKESQDRINFFLEHTAEGVYRIDYVPPIPISLPFEEQYKLSRERGRFGECNTAIARMYGYASREEMLAAPYYVEDEGYEASLQANLEFYRRGYKADDSETEEYTPSGAKAYFLNNAVGIVRDGNFMSIWGTQRDITPLKKALADLERLNLELEQRVEQRTAELQVANKELEAFSYSVSHDLRAPLRAIRGFSEVLARDFGDQFDPMTKSFLDKVVGGAGEMSDKIDGLLRFSRLSRGELHWQPLDLSALATDALETLRAGQPGRLVTYEVTPHLKAQGDQVLIRNVLENLLGNAWKYSSKNPQAHIQFGATEVDGKTVYFVRDNGAGFNMEYANKLFGTFQRLHRADEFEGHGIGLATVQRIIHRHGGRIWAEAEEGKGATFYFMLGRSA